MQEKSNTEKRYIADSKDVTVEDWSDPMADKYGLKATTRYGLGVLRSNAKAKMTNMKTKPIVINDLIFCVCDGLGGGRVFVYMVCIYILFIW